MFGIGQAELLIMLVIALLTIGFPVGIVVLGVLLRKEKISRGDRVRVAHLQEENRDLRDELAKLKKTSER